MVPISCHSFCVVPGCLREPIGMSELGLFTIWFIVVMSLATAFSNWYELQVQYRREGEMFGEFRFVGIFRTVTRFGPRDTVVIKLPSYDWQRDWCHLDEWCWHQRMLVKRDRWRIELWPC